MERIKPENKDHWLRLRAEDITSTEVSALFDASPYMTHFELWHRKKQKSIGDFADNERTRWGTRLQDSIARGIAEDNNWEVEPMTDYIRRPALRIGSSFDFFIGDDGILEIKNVDSLVFRDNWIVNEDKSIEAPVHIELQVQHQLAVSGRKYAYIGALVGGNDLKLIRRESNLKVMVAITNKVNEFWKSIENNTPPVPDFKKDFEYIKELYNYAEPNKTIGADAVIDVLVSAYQIAAAQEKAAKENKEAAKAELLTLIGNAERVRGSDYTISAGIIGPADVSFHREAYRNFKISFKKGK